MRLLTVVLAIAIAVTGCAGEDAEPPAGASATATASRSQSPSTDASPSTSGSPSASAAVPAFQIAGGGVRGPSRISVQLGTDVVFTVTSDVADEVHIHGYDQSVDVAAGRTVTVRLTADIPGVFEVEMERAHLPVTQLRVAP